MHFRFYYSNFNIYVIRAPIIATLIFMSIRQDRNLGACNQLQTVDLHMTVNGELAF